MMSGRSDSHYMDITELAALLRAREISSREITVAMLDRIASIDGSLHSYASIMADRALLDAETADAEFAKGQVRGPLHGVPLAVKDNCWTAGHATAAGMAIHKDFLPAEDATVVRRLRDAGAILLGKSQLTEGAYSDYHPTVVPPKNPWHADYWTGISSSGSAVATAAGLCFGALGTDTGGSIRWPSAANGVTGLKPTWGRVSRHGVFELAASLDHVGTLARSAIDAGLLLGAIAGHDPHDPTSRPDEVPDYFEAAKQGAQNLRIGVDAKWNEHDVDDSTQRMLSEAVQTFRALGAQIVAVTLPDASDVIADWVPNCAVEAAVAHEATYSQHAHECGPVLAGVVEHGRKLSGTEYQKILLRRMDFSGRMAAVLNRIDVLLTPVQPVAPLTLATISTLGAQPELISQLQRYTCPFDMSGHPTITLPAGRSKAGLPMGVQLVAASMREELLVRAGAAFQTATRWHRLRPLP